MSQRRRPGQRRIENRGSTGSAGSCEFIKLHPEDNGSFLEILFFRHPDNFVPKRNQRGEVHGWGLWSYDDEGRREIDIRKIMDRTMLTQHFYQSPSVKPQVQFVNALIAKKVQKLESLDLGRLQHKDYVIRLTMPNIPLIFQPDEAFRLRLDRGRPVDGEDMIFRRFRVSGGINLDTLEDKVIIPIMGWKRNFHAYIFTDFTDGGCFGPRDCSTVDMMYKDGMCYEYINADEFTLAHLAQEKGTRFEYQYDFGDHWIHHIEVEDILDEGESNGCVTVLGGRGMCPPEDGHGNYSWAEALWQYKFGPPARQNGVLQDVFSAPNYEGQPFKRFDPLEFSVEDAQKKVTAAVSSKASVRSGARNFVTPFRSNILTNSKKDPRNSNLKKSQSVVRTPSENNSSGYYEEIVSKKRDDVNRALCAVCGTPHDLKACSRCRLIYYCGSDHQRQHWSTHKPDCKPAKPK